MKIAFFDGKPIYVSKERGEALQQQLMIGAKLIDIDGNLYNASSIKAVTKESDPSQWGHDVSKKRLNAAKHERASVDSVGYKKFLQMKHKLLH